MLRALLTVLLFSILAAPAITLPIVGTRGVYYGSACTTEAAMDAVGAAFARNGLEALQTELVRQREATRCGPLLPIQIQTTGLGRSYWHGTKSVTVMRGAAVRNGQLITIYILLDGEAI